MTCYSKVIWVFIFFIYLSTFSPCYGEDTILYKQRVNRFELNFNFFLKDNRGIIYLNDNCLTFKTKKIKMIL